MKFFLRERAYTFYDLRSRRRYAALPNFRCRSTCIHTKCMRNDRIRSHASRAATARALITVSLQTAIFLRLAVFNDRDNVMKVTNRRATKAR